MKKDPYEKKRREIEAAARRVFAGAKAKRRTASDIKADQAATKAKAASLRKRTIAEKVRQDLDVNERKRIKRIFSKLGSSAEKAVDRRGAKATLKAGIIVLNTLKGKQQTHKTEFWKSVRYERIDRNNPKSKWELWQDGKRLKGRFEYKEVRRMAFKAKQEKYIHAIAQITGHPDKFVRKIIKDIRAEQTKEIKRFKRSKAFKRLSSKEKRRYTIRRGTWAILRTMADLLQIVGTDPKGAK